MNYHLNKKRRPRNLKNILLVIFILIIIIFLNKIIFRGVSNTSAGIFSPLYKIGSRIGDNFNNFATYFRSKQKLEKDNTILKNINNNLLAQTDNYQILKEENENLKNILNRTNKKENLVLATILSKPSVSFFDTLIVDVGEKNGVLAGDLVLAYGDIPIGRVSEVYRNTSKITLFSSSGEKTTGIIKGKDIYVEVIGRGGNNFEIILPSDLNIYEGIKILLPDIYPYVFAEVKSIITDPRDLYQKALLVSPINVQEIKFVEIAK